MSVVFTKFLYKDGSVFPHSMFTEHMITNCTADQWWNTIMVRANLNDDTPTFNFAKLIKSLHLCPASSAGIERWFSTVGFVWSKVRNRLGVNKAHKLASVFRGLRETEKQQKKKGSADKASDHQAAGYSAGSTNSGCVDEESLDFEGNDDVFEFGDLFEEEVDINVDDIDEPESLNVEADSDDPFSFPTPGTSSSNSHGRRPKRQRQLPSSSSDEEFHGFASQPDDV